MAVSPPLLTTIEATDIDTNALLLGGLPVEPPDPYGAAGPDHVLNVTNVSIQWFTKAGVKQMETSLGSFFSALRPVQTAALGVFDPKTLYDQYADRFVVIALEMLSLTFGDQVDQSRILVAVSDDSDPNGTWYYTSINATVNVPDPTNPGTTISSWTDYPGLGLDDEAIYITGNLFDYATFTQQRNRLWIVDKGLGRGGFYENGRAVAKIFDPATVSGVDFTGNFTGGPASADFRSMAAAQMLGTAPAGVGTWLALYDGFSDNVNEFVDLIRVDNPLSASPVFTRFHINVGDIEDTSVAMGPVPQRGTTALIDGGDRRVINAVWRNDSLYVTTVILPDEGDNTNQVTAHWFRFNTSNPAAVTLADQGDVGGEEIAFGAHTIWPAVMVDTQDNMAIGFSAMGASLYAGSYYAVRAKTDPPGTLRDARALAEGLDNYGFPNARNRWGDYTSIALDPTDGVTFWAYNEYALPFGPVPGILGQLIGPIGRWGTRWGSFRLADAPPPPPVGPTTISGVIYHDENENRRRDTTERGLSGWMVYVDTDLDGLRDLGEPAVTTDAAGRYSVTVDGAGPFTVRQSIKPGWRQTSPSGNAPQTATSADATNKDFGNSDADGFDHGDAPAPYPTLEAANGPTHAILAGFGLGTTATGDVLVDGEPDGLPDAAALGDDNSGSDDENGVVVPDLVRNTAATVTVTVSLGSNAPGLLQGWIDFNRDGDWADAGEQVFTNVALGQGTHLLTVNVPAAAIPGETFARFRYGQERNLSFTGPAFIGEVEDYRVVILSDELEAIDDQATVLQNSDFADNIIPVLANDNPGPSGRANMALTAVNTSVSAGSAIIDNNNTPNNRTDDFIRYRPAPGALAPDSFTYTITDLVSGDTDTATVLITILPVEGDAPFAVDDSFEFVNQAPLGQPRFMDLDPLTNDLTGPTGVISIPPNGLDTTTYNTVGTLQIIQPVSGPQVVRYSPPTSFSGTDVFKYTIVDASNVQATAIVTVFVPIHTTDDKVRFHVTVTDLNGAPLPNNEIGQGFPFKVNVFVDDARGELGHPPLPSGLTPSDQGVFSAYMDLLYDADRVLYAGDSQLTFSSNYPLGREVDSTVQGILSEVGAFRDVATPLGPSEQLLYSAVFTADELGTVTFKTDPADNIPLHETLLHQPPEAVDPFDEIEYGTASLTVIAAPDLMRIRLAVADLQGNPLPTSQVTPGTQFLVQAYVDDLRTIASSQQGVFSAYLDVAFNSQLVTPVPDLANPHGFNITYGTLFREAQTGSVAGSIIEEVGASQSLSPVFFGGEQLLFSIRFLALTPPGGGIGTVTFRADAAESPFSDLTLLGLNTELTPSQVDYVNAPPITIVPAGGEGEFTNPTNRFDVNNDGYVSPFDVLLVVNFLNDNGALDLSPFVQGGEGEPQGGYFYDVNGDLVISPADVLGVINAINALLAGQSSGEGEGSSDVSGEPLAPLAEGIADAANPIPWDILDPRSESGGERASVASAAVRDPLVEETAVELVRGADQRSYTADRLDLVLSDDLAEDVANAWGDFADFDQVLAEMV